MYEIKEVDALSAKALLRVYEQLGLSAAADRLGAISSEQPICKCIRYIKISQSCPKLNIWLRSSMVI